MNPSENISNSLSILIKDSTLEKVIEIHSASGLQSKGWFNSTTNYDKKKGFENYVSKSMYDMSKTDLKNLGDESETYNDLEIKHLDINWSILQFRNYCVISIMSSSKVFERIDGSKETFDFDESLLFSIQAFKLPFLTFIENLKTNNVNFITSYLNRDFTYDEVRDYTISTFEVEH